MKLLEVVRKSKDVVEIWLNRPEIHNAFNDQLIEEMITLFDSFQDERLIILGGRGKSFCAGADLHWMKAMRNYSEEENFNDSKRLAKMFEVMNACDIPIIARVHGHALGGGVGLLAVCDYVLSVPEVRLGFTEVRLGLIPAVISPYCIAKIGESNARAWMISGEKFSAEEGKRMGLIHEVCLDLDSRLEEIKSSFLMAGPKAAKEIKKLMRKVIARQENVQDLTCQMISQRRISDEGQEGMRALLEKNKPGWIL